jgi:predicted Zn-dependent protease
VQAGGGYGSQNSYVQVLGVIEGESPAAVEVTWPGGRVETVEIDESGKEIRVENKNNE